MKQVYILLTRTNTIPARMIQRFTGDRYTHASLGLDRNLLRLYSFARKHPDFPLIAGFLLENIHTGVFGRNRHAPAALYALDIPDEAYAALERELELMAQESERYHYSFLGLAAAACRIPLSRKYHYVCSHFVAEMLHRYGQISFDCDHSLIKPSDLQNLPGARLIYEGPLYKCAERKANKRALVPSLGVS